MLPQGEFEVVKEKNKLPEHLTGRKHPHGVFYTTKETF